jgi:hypothetical protein
MCAASASATTWGSGTVRYDACVFGGPNDGGRVCTSCRSTRSVRRRKSTRSTVTPAASPGRSPVPAIMVTIAASRAVIAPLIAITVSVARARPSGVPCAAA